MAFLQNTSEILPLNFEMLTLLIYICGDSDGVHLDSTEMFTYEKRAGIWRSRLHFYKNALIKENKQTLENHFPEK